MKGRYSKLHTTAIASLQLPRKKSIYTELLWHINLQVSMTYGLAYSNIPSML